MSKPNRKQIDAARAARAARAAAPATLLATYDAARATGDMDDACRALKAAHGVSIDDAVAFCWAIETGAEMPKFQYEDGAPTPAAMAFDRGLERRMVGE